MEENKICSECGTENEEKFEFCKNCGKELETQKSEQSANSNTDHSAPNGQYGGVYNDFIIPETDGIPNDEVAAFVGGKASKIIPKFAKMQVTNTKISWCWPVAILSYFFGPLGAAFWYLYRKMYKMAVIFFAIAIVLSVAVSFVPSSLLGDENETVSYEEIFDTYENYINGEIDFEEYMNKISDSMSDMAITNPISQVTDIIFLVITGLFSYHWYKNKVIKSIKKIKAVHTDSRYYHFALAANGGTSGGAVVLGLIIYYAILSAIIGVLIFAFGVNLF